MNRWLGSFRKHQRSISLTQAIAAGTWLTHNFPGGNAEDENYSHIDQSIRIDGWKGHWSSHLFWNSGSTETWRRRSRIIRMRFLQRPRPRDVNEGNWTKSRAESEPRPSSLVNPDLQRGTCSLLCRTAWSRQCYYVSLELLYKMDHITEAGGGSFSEDQETEIIDMVTADIRSFKIQRRLLEDQGIFQSIHVVPQQNRLRTKQFLLKLWIWASVFSHTVASPWVQLCLTAAYCRTGYMMAHYHWAVFSSLL